MIRLGPEVPHGCHGRELGDQSRRRLLPARDPASYTLAELWRWSRGTLPHTGSPDADDRLLLRFLAETERAAATGGAPSFADWLRGEGVSL